MVEGAGFEIRFARKGNAGSNPVPSAKAGSRPTEVTRFGIPTVAGSQGEVTEWSKVHAC